MILQLLENKTIFLFCRKLIHKLHYIVVKKAVVFKPAVDHLLYICAELFIGFSFIKVTLSVPLLTEFLYDIFGSLDSSWLGG